MDKKKYLKPVLNSEEFVPQEYIAACGDANKVYKFECNAPAGYVYKEDNHVPGLQKNGGYDKNYGWYPSDSPIGGYTPCGATHDAKTTEVFERGYVDTGHGITDVVMWRPKIILWFKNIHCTENLEIDQWETAKS